MDEFELELKKGFLEEAAQLQEEAEQCFLDLEKNPGDQANLEKIFRIAHNIKGSSKAVGFDNLGAFTHEFETFLLKVKRGEIPTDQASVSLLLEGNDHLRAFLEALRNDLTASLDSAALIAKFQNFQSSRAVVPPAEPAEDEGPTAAEVAAAMPEAIAPGSEAVEFAQITDANLPKEMPISKAPAPKPAAAPAGASASGSSEESIRVSLARLERLVNLVGEVAIMHTVLREQVPVNCPPLLRRTVHQLGKVTKELQDLAMGLRMVPLKQTFQKMQRIVRDTSLLLGKQVELEIEGENTEVDKTVLESLGDPLVHMVRNAVDHGLEKPEDRATAGKNPQGKVYLRAFHQSGRLVIEVQDDGKGIDANVLRRKAEEKGILKPGAVLSDQEAVHLIFHPGFSTKAEVSEVSGRGVGMDVVKSNIEALQGDVKVETEVGKGSRFRVTLPLTLAIIDGMVVSSGDERYVIPLSHVHESVRPASGDVRKTTGSGELLMLRGENLPVIRLGRVLGQRKPQDRKVEDCIAVIVRLDDQPLAALVDDILGQHQVVIKDVGPELKGVRGISGSAILGDGRPALILEIPDLLKDRRAS